MINTFINDDCLNVFPLIADHSIDLILCDLPYGTTGCAWDSIIPFDLLWAQYKRIMKPAGVVVLTASQPFTTKVISSNYQMFKYEYIWQKNRCSNFQLAKHQPLKAHESVLVFANKKALYQPQGLTEINKVCTNNNNMRNLKHIQVKEKNFIQTHTGYPKSIITFPTEVGLHPTQKPVSLFKYLIETHCPAGGTVLDNCAGVATTAIAAIQTNRNYICIEMDPHYYAIGLDRINKELNTL